MAKTVYRYLLLLLSGLLALNALAQPDDDDDADEQDLPEVHLPEFTDLETVATRAEERRLPILLLFSMEGCGYCNVVIEQFLKPMLRSGDYEDRVIMGIIRLDRYDELVDFDGGRINSVDIAVRYRVPVTPTVVFVSSKGHELARRLIGVTTVDFYGGDLDAAIDYSLFLLRPYEYRDRYRDYKLNPLMRLRTVGK